MPSRFVMIAVALVLPLGLTACGVRGPLELPPAAKASAQPAANERPPATTQEMPGTRIIGQSVMSSTPSATTRAAASGSASGRRIAPDWLID